MRRSRDTKTILYAGGKTQLQKIYLSDVVIGGGQWKRLEAFLLKKAPDDQVNFDGVIGVSSLKIKRIHFDFQEALISWER